MKQPFTPKQAILAHIEVHSKQVVRSVLREYLTIVNNIHRHNITGESYDPINDLLHFKAASQYRVNCKNIMVRNYKHLTGATEQELIEVLNGILYFLSQNLTYNKTVYKYTSKEETVERAAEMIAQNTGLLLMESLNQ